MKHEIIYCGANGWYTEQTPNLQTKYIRYDLYEELLKKLESKNDK